MKETKTLHLQLFEGKDNFDYEVLNDNMEKIDNARSSVSEDYYYEVLMKDATFEHTLTYGKWANGQIMGFCLFLQSTYDVNDDYQIIISNGVETLRLNCNKLSDGINAFIDGTEFVWIRFKSTPLNASGMWNVVIRNTFYTSRTEDVKITVLHKMQEEKILVHADGTPLTKPLILDPSIDYSKLPFKGDEAWRAIDDGRVIQIQVPNSDGGTRTTNRMPIIQHQLPNEDNDYLYLIYMKDGIKTNFETALQTGDFGALCGQIKMQVSEECKNALLK